MGRHESEDDDWERIKDMLPGQPGDPGVTAKDNRLFINAVLWIGKTGAPWRDLPERFGRWGSALPLNLRPYAPRSNRPRTHDSPAHRLNGKRYHEHWLHDLMASTSLMGFRHRKPAIR